jgi:ribonuclease R
MRRGGKPQGPVKPMSQEMELWEATGGHCSANERRANEASRDVEAWLKCRYMREKLGEEFAGTVTAVTSFGLFVTLDALYVEGLVHITELGGEYYRFDDARMELRGERTGIRYGVGTRVRVQVSRVDLDGRKIDFRMVRDGEGERPLIRGDRASDRASDRGNVGKGASASEELAALQSADRSAKAASKSRKGPGKGAGKGGSGGAVVGGLGGATTHRSRKPGPQRPAPKPRTRR